MRSLFGRIFISTLLIYPLSRGLGFLLFFLLGAPAPPPPPPRPEVLREVLPLYAEAGLATLQHGGEPALARFIAGQERATGLRLEFAPSASGGCVGMPAGEPPRPGEPIAVPVAGADGTRYCLTARLERPRVGRLAFITGAFLLPLEFACCAVVSFMLARYLDRPLRDLHAAALAFADGDLTARGRDVNRGRFTEAAELVRAFNRMADRISRLIQSQQRFIADVSHEIKSPLARLSLAAALARRSAPPGAADQFDRIEREIETASSLVRELQVLASLEASTALTRRDPIDLERLLAAAIDNVAFEWQGRPHGLRLAAPPDPVVMHGDAPMLQRAIENVLRNALFYTPEGTEVEVTVGRGTSGARIEIRDHGPGVPEPALPHLFDPFYRVDESRGRNTGGVGIGLAIFARTIALHGGQAVAANAVPSGLRICIDLPLAHAGDLDPDGPGDRPAVTAS